MGFQGLSPAMIIMRRLTRESRIEIRAATCAGLLTIDGTDSLEWEKLSFHRTILFTRRVSSDLRKRVTEGFSSKEN